jgi:hypothetical protein
MAIVIEQFRVLAGLDSSDAAKDADIEAAIEIGQSLMESYCDRGLIYAPDAVEKFVHHSDEAVQLYRYPIEEVTFFNTSPVTDQSKVSNRTGIVFMDFHDTSGSFTVTYTAGYQYIDFPSDLTMILKNIFKAIYDSIEGVTPEAAGVVKSVKLGDMTVAYDTGANTINYSGAAFGPFNALQIAVLDRYRRLKT